MPFFDTALTYAVEHPITAGLVILGVSLSAYIIHASSPPLSMTPTLPGPRGWPLVGSFFSRGRDPAETYRLWSKIYGPVFKDRLGSTYVAVINGADEADELLAHPKYAAATMSRPVVSLFLLLLSFLYTNFSCRAGRATRSFATTHAL
jgi:3-hydroxyphenylacetate 6-hydroxylase